ncbi:hypothetical protein MKX01_017402, partial [Papaver californicum]
SSIAGYLLGCHGKTCSLKPEHIRDDNMKDEEIKDKVVKIELDEQKLTTLRLELKSIMKGLREAGVFGFLVVMQVLGVL